MFPVSRLHSWCLAWGWDLTSRIRFSLETLGNPSRMAPHSVPKKPQQTASTFPLGDLLQKCSTSPRAVRKNFEMDRKLTRHTQSKPQSIGNPRLGKSVRKGMKAVVICTHIRRWNTGETGENWGEKFGDRNEIKKNLPDTGKYFDEETFDKIKKAKVPLKNLCTK